MTKQQEHQLCQLSTSSQLTHDEANELDKLLAIWYEEKQRQALEDVANLLMS